MRVHKGGLYKMQDGGEGFDLSGATKVDFRRNRCPDFLLPSPFRCAMKIGGC